MESVSLFTSYSHRDEKFRDELLTHLSPLRRSGLIESWHDRCIRPGRKWAVEIDHAIERADVILALISADFIASDYCYEKEMGRAFERHETGEAVVVPVVIRSVVWEHTPLADLQALPQDARPVEEWKYRDRAWADVVRGVIEVAHGVFNEANEVRATSRETRSTLGLPPDTIAQVDALDIDEGGPENLIEQWPDTMKLGRRFPQLASSLAEYRRDKEALEKLKLEEYKDAMAITKLKLPMELITFLVNIIQIENLKERIKVRTKELEVLSELEDANREQSTASLRKQLDPQILGLSVSSVSDNSLLLTSEMSEYANALRTADNLAKIVRKEVLEPLRELAE